jgi:hypothetical protein
MFIESYAAPLGLENHCATISINIPRLRRSGIKKFASGIAWRRAPKAPPIYAQPSDNYSI